MKTKLSVFFLLTLLVSNAYAVTENNKTITKVGVQGSNAYFTVAGGFSGSCNWNNVYIDLNSTAGKAQYTMLLTANINGTALGRIDYFPNSSGGCFLNLIEIN